MLAHRVLDMHGRQQQEVGLSVNIRTTHTVREGQQAVLSAQLNKLHSNATGKIINWHVP